MRNNTVSIMQFLFGTDLIHTCEQCCNLIRIKYHGKSYAKCAIYGQTHSRASDWKVHALACGRFNKPMEEGEIPVIERRKHAGRKATEQPLPGQISMLDDDTPR